MSKQDIEKRLGFAAQGVKETTRSSAKAKMAKRMVVDTITSGNQKHELGYESVMQPVAAGEPPHEWFRPIVRTTNLDTGKSSEKASQPHYTEKSARDWLKNYASSVKPSTDPLYAEYASNREKISKMMTRLAQARNNPELRQKLQAESDKLDARQREVAAQLQKRKSSRTGAKAKFVRIVTTPQGRYTTNLDKNTRAPIEGGKGYVMVDPAMYITPKRVRVQGTKGEIEVQAIVEGKEIVGVSAKLVSARPGVKAKMGLEMNMLDFRHKFFTAFGAAIRDAKSNPNTAEAQSDEAVLRESWASMFAQGYSDAISDLSGLSATMKSKTSVSQMRKAASDAMETYRQAKAAVRAARPGVKAKFATEVGRKGNKSAMISRDATGTWYAYVVQRIETGIGKDEDMLGTMRAYSTEDRAKRAAIKALDTSGFSRPAAKAKA